MSIIEINNLTKEFRLGEMNNLKQVWQRISARWRGEAPPVRRRFKALNNVNLKIESGEVLGIIGTNGAGKSTLLKILSGIMAPTQGNIEVRGSIAPLIEVGAGLVNEMTGRENVFLNAAILGIPKQEIKRRVDEIIEFTELGDFIDTPIKRYSSGMRVRLGFSIATSVDPDILIVDEVLAVGDLAFQRKCFDRLEELIRRQGKTVLIVSHNIRQIQRLCGRVILLDSGSIIADSDPQDVAQLFYERSNKSVQQYQVKKQDAKSNIKSSGEVELLDVDILNGDGNVIDEIESGDPLCVRLRFALHHMLERPEIVVGTHTTDFIYLTADSTALLEERPALSAGIHELVYIVRSFPFASGVYCIRMAIFDQYGRLIFRGETLKVFSVHESNRLGKAGLRMLNLPTEFRVNGEKYTLETGDSNYVVPATLVSLRE